MPSGLTIAFATRGLVERAAVAEGGVRARQLQRRDQRVALADREVHRVAGPVVAALEAELVGEDVQEGRASPSGLRVDLAVVVLHRLPVGELPLPVGDPAAASPGRSMPVSLPKPNFLAPSTSGSLASTSVGSVP